MNSAINWFEIPALDFERAVTFYNTILATNLRMTEVMDERNGVFPYERGSGTGGSVVAPRDVVSSNGGPLIYLNANPSLSAVVGRVEKAGGRVVQPETSVGPIGVIAIIIDTEGNRIGLHADQ